MKIGIIGTGMFGFSIARHLGKKHIENKDISIFTYDTNKKLIDHLKKNRLHLYHFNNVKLPKNVFFTHDIKEVIIDSDIIIMAVNSSSVSAGITYSLFA